MFRFRLLPLILVAAFVVIFLKASDMLLGASSSSSSAPSAAIAVAAEVDVEDEIYVPDAPVLSPNAPAGPEAMQPEEGSQVERDLLESLSRRREELQEWSESIAMRENILNATEMKINQKITDLKALESNVSALLAQYNEQEDAKISSLVKIYESMKPKDAANIFNKLEMNILLAVVDAMSERRVAPILAKLNPDKARRVTEALAQERRLTMQGAN